MGAAARLCKLRSHEGAMTAYHEPPETLPTTIRDAHRALTSFKEELEAIDWYNQRVAVTEDAQLQRVLAHNRDEEIEHACMTLEWLRRNMPVWDEKLRAYLFTSTPITEIEESNGGAGGGRAPFADLGIGSLRGRS